MSAGINPSPLTAINSKRFGGVRNSQRTTQQIKRRAAELLELHPHFRGRGGFVQFQCVGNRLILNGCLPSYYLKQLAQEAIRPMAAVIDQLQIENQIVVASPVGEVIPASVDPEVFEGFGIKQKTEGHNTIDQVIELKIDVPIRRIPR